MGGSRSPVSTSEDYADDHLGQLLAVEIAEMDAPPVDSQPVVGDITFVAPGGVDQLSAGGNPPTTPHLGLGEVAAAGIIEPAGDDEGEKTERIDGNGNVGNDPFDGDRSGAEDDYVTVNKDQGGEGAQPGSPSVSSAGSHSGSPSRSTSPLRPSSINRPARASPTSPHSASLSSLLKRATSLSFDRSHPREDPQASPRRSGGTSDSSSDRSPSICLAEGGSDGPAGSARRRPSQGRRSPPRRLVQHQGLPPPHRSGTMLWCTMLVLMAVLSAVLVAHVAARYRLPMGPLAAMRAYVRAHRGAEGASFGAGDGERRAVGRVVRGGEVGSGPFGSNHGPFGARGFHNGASDAPESALDRVPLFRAAFCLTGATTEEVAEAFLRAARGEEVASAGAGVNRGEGGKGVGGSQGGAYNSRRPLLPFAVARELLGDALMSARLAAQSQEEENLVLADDGEGEGEEYDDGYAYAEYAAAVVKGNAGDAGAHHDAGGDEDSCVDSDGDRVGVRGSGTKCGAGNVSAGHHRDGKGSHRHHADGDRAFWYTAFWHTERAQGSGADGSIGGGGGVGAALSGSLSPLHTHGSFPDALLRRVYAVPEALLPGLPSVSTCVAVAGLELSSRRHLSDWETTTTRRLVSWGEADPRARQQCGGSKPPGARGSRGVGASQDGEDGVMASNVAAGHGCGGEHVDEGGVNDDGLPPPSLLDNLVMLSSRVASSGLAALYELPTHARRLREAPLSAWSPSSLWSAAKAAAASASDALYSAGYGSAGAPTPRFVDVVKRRPLFKRHVAGEGDVAWARARMRAAVAAAGGEYLARRDRAEERERAAPGGCCQ